MAITVQMPALGESVTEGTVTRWLKQEGDTVEVDEPLLEVSTDKVDTEIPSPAAGVLTKIIANEDDTVEVGGDLGTIGDADEGDGGDSAPAADLKYLKQWVAEHHGVEAFVEPKTTVTEVTVVLVAADGEWTRRRAGGDKGARQLSDKLDIPVYDVQKVGYPQRMRDFDARRRIERKRELRRELEDD